MPFGGISFPGHMSPINGELFVHPTEGTSQYNYQYIGSETLSRNIGTYNATKQEHIPPYYERCQINPIEQEVNMLPFGVHAPCSTSIYNDMNDSKQQLRSCREGFQLKQALRRYIKWSVHDSQEQDYPMNDYNRRGIFQEEKCTLMEEPVMERLPDRAGPFKGDREEIPHSTQESLWKDLDSVKEFVPSRPIDVERSLAAAMIPRRIVGRNQIPAKGGGGGVDQITEETVQIGECYQSASLPCEEEEEFSQSLLFKTEFSRYANPPEMVRRPMNCVSFGNAIYKRMHDPTDLHDTRDSLSAYLGLLKFARIWKPLGQSPDNPDFTNNVMVWDVFRVRDLRGRWFGNSATNYTMMHRHLNNLDNEEKRRQYLPPFAIEGNSVDCFRGSLDSAISATLWKRGFDLI